MDLIGEVHELGKLTEVSGNIGALNADLVHKFPHVRSDIVWQVNKVLPVSVKNLNFSADETEKIVIDRLGPFAHLPHFLNCGSEIRDCINAKIPHEVRPVLAQHPIRNPSLHPCADER